MTQVAKCLKPNHKIPYAKQINLTNKIHTENRAHTTNQIYTGIIEKCQDDTFFLVYDLGVIQAKKATSCLLMPEVADKVAFLQVTQTEAYILHILERKESKGTLLLPHNTSICQESEQAHTNNLSYFIPNKNTDNEETENKDIENKDTENGATNNKNTLKDFAKQAPAKLTIQTDTCAFLAHDTLEFQAQNIKECAKNINLTAHQTVFTGTTLTMRFKSIRNFCDHALYKIKYYMGFYDKKIEKIETLMDTEAKQAHMNIEENLRIRSKRASLKSKESVNIDAKHINIG